MSMSTGSVIFLGLYSLVREGSLILLDAAFCPGYGPLSCGPLRRALEESLCFRCIPPNPAPRCE